MVLITIVMGVYKPTYNWGAPHCTDRGSRICRISGFLCKTQGAGALVLSLEEAYAKTKCKNKVPSVTHGETNVHYPELSSNLQQPAAFRHSTIALQSELPLLDGVRRAIECLVAQSFKIPRFQPPLCLA